METKKDQTNQTNQAKTDQGPANQAKGTANQTGTTSVTPGVGGGKGGFGQTQPPETKNRARESDMEGSSSDRPGLTPKSEAKTEPKDKPWNKAFPPPADGTYDVQCGDKVVRATHAGGLWKTKDGRSIGITGWRE